jgi:hypothetical protein
VTKHPSRDRISRDNNIDDDDGGYDNNVFISTSINSTPSESAQLPSLLLMAISLDAEQ